MIFHLSLPARDPGRVAAVMAELWRGEAFPFHPIPGAWIAMAGDAHGTALEVYPAETVLIAGDTALDSETGPTPANTASHAAVETPLSEAEVHAIAEREGWLARRCDRGPFQLIELWVEGWVLVELLTAEMAADYRSSMTIENWRSWT